MRAATYTFNRGVGHKFTLEAFRHAFGRGLDLSIVAHVLRAGRAAGIDPDDLRAAMGDPQVKGDLRTATSRAFERGVIGVPTVAVGDMLFWGDDRLEEAAARLAAGTPKR